MRMSVLAGERQPALLREAPVQGLLPGGATLLFAFFMISDPMTTPQYARARIAYAIAVAAAAFTWQYVLFKPHGLILMLAAASALVPVINWRWRQRRFEWAHG